MHAPGAAHPRRVPCDHPNLVFYCKATRASLSTTNCRQLFQVLDHHPNLSSFDHAMTEYWVSKQSYYCKYCEIYIRDDKPSRSQHENGLRHKGNLERYIRDIYKKEERTQHESREEARAIAKIEEAARIAHENLDLNSASTSKRTLSDRQEETNDPDEPNDPKKRTKAAKEDWKGAENVNNYSDARSLGLAIDEEEPTEDDKEARMKEGFIGQWQAVTRIPKPTKASGTLVGSACASARTTTTDKISGKLVSQDDGERAPPSKLFAERRIDEDLDSTKEIVIKVKVDRRAQARVKREQEAAEAGLHIHGSLQPIRLDGTQSESLPSRVVKSEAAFAQQPLSCSSPSVSDLDVKPSLAELVQDEPVQPPLTESKVSTVFKKRKPTKAQPRQRT
ncbi:hypothetical protein CROQUDRAFT_660416 [Cronartium quercuum f. sp. fusiforme G11]|uniref:Matrin-type domain-containing protein n=1 Tax=Cronartium quercuum f. sp. fusiforme G11 TaxID=708437 RepID=A0A9P6T9C9_9BASI|nr:hypothetical protein CROQUDRAFT_660416 [Cronartium quercuum f. sp. fusiforme G11]